MAFQTICLALPIGFSIFKDVMTFLYSFELSFYIELGLKIESVSSSNGIILFLPTCICILEHYVIGQYIVDVLCRQPIKLFKVVSTSEFHEY